VAEGGYAWWYVDALSDDGAHALTLIAFVGSVFSPYYAWQRRRGVADPQNHCAVNLALYRPDRPGGKRWAMTERGRAALARDATHLRIGPSALAWHDDGAQRGLHVTIDETTVPFPSRLRGRLHVRPLAVMHDSYVLDARGRHRWHPIAPLARVEVEFTAPALRWQGEAYLDSNFGDAPLEADFARWDWSRAHLPGGRVAVFYDVTRRDGSPHGLALQFDAAGTVRPIEPPPHAPLGRTGWRVERGTRSDAGAPARVLKTLEDTPFYARSLVRSQLHGEPATAVHESLSLARFASPIVQAMLPFRMPRRSR
jgi:carotenoid 1,2-hydratase